MKDFLVFVPLTVAFLSVKSTLMPTVPVFDLPLIVAFYLAYTRPSLHGVVLCFVLGYLDNVFNSSVIGASSSALALVYGLTHLAAKRVHFTSAVSRAAGCMAAALVKGTLIYFVWRGINPDLHYVSGVVPVAVATAIFAPIIISLIEKNRVMGSAGRAEGGLA
jgi:rod shape-determining protein MreD